jgi:hypothetical protein
MPWPDILAILIILSQFYNTIALMITFLTKNSTKIEDCLGQFFYQDFLKILWWSLVEVLKVDLVS